MSASAKKSATSGTNPARLAEAASARPDTAATIPVPPGESEKKGALVRATELMVPVARTPDSMVFYASAVLGEDFHEAQMDSLQALIDNTIGHAQPWPIKSVMGDPALCITEEAESQDSELLVIPGNSYHAAASDAERCAKATLDFIARRGAA